MELKSKPSNPETHTIDSSSYLNLSILGKNNFIYPEESHEPPCMKDIPTRNDIDSRESQFGHSGLSVTVYRNKSKFREHKPNLAWVTILEQTYIVCHAPEREVNS